MHQAHLKIAFWLPHPIVVVDGIIQKLHVDTKTLEILGERLKLITSGHIFRHLLHHLPEQIQVFQFQTSH